MMPERTFHGLPASPGLAAGGAVVLDQPAEPTAEAIPEARRAEEARRALRALEAAALQLEQLAAGLPAEEAEIVETGALMARDPALASDVERLVASGVGAPAALVAAAERHAAALAAIPDEMLAARADDVRSLARRAARLARGEGDIAGRRGVILATELGPADVAELHESACAFALSAGGPTAHAAIVARSLGVPMITGLGDGIFSLPPGAVLVVDGDDGTLTAAPAAERLEAAHAATRARAATRRRAADQRRMPAVTTDGHDAAVLANVAAAAEVTVALEAGADGVGLVRTELAFLTASRWPSEAEHLRALRPVLAPLRGMPVTVRVLDFGGDKLPPFLAGEADRGTSLLLEHPDALADQLRAIVRAGAGCDLRIMLPLVDDPAQLEAVRAITRASGVKLGAMVETPRAAERSALLARHSDFLSIGTNDLSAATLGVDRFAGGPAPAHDPRVLRLVALTVRSAEEAGIPLEVCGEAASDPVVLPLLLGLGVREVSVGAARVGTVRAWIRSLSLAEARALAERAVRAPDAETVARLAAPLTVRLGSVEGEDAAAQRLEGDGGVVAVGAQP